jgi:hypothetical protein
MTTGKWGKAGLFAATIPAAAQKWLIATPVQLGSTLTRLMFLRANTSSLSA